MNIRIQEGDIHRLDLRTRMPFKYGIATMTNTPHVFVRLQVEIDGKLYPGISADHLPPKWFTKDPARAIDEEVAEMVRVIDHAVRIAIDLRGDSAFEVWRQMWAAQGSWGKEQRLPSLLTHFGTSLIERALIEAVCRAQQQPFARLLFNNAFGIRLVDIHADLEGRQPSHFIDEQSRPSMLIRHTVGMADPLTDADILPEERLDDGLPQSLVTCIRAYGLRQFKIKVSGDLKKDLDRLHRLSEILRTHAPEDYRFSFDGNEQFHSLGDFAAFWQELSRNPSLQEFFRHLHFIEQPLHRDVALQLDLEPLLSDLPTRLPIIIDESDGDLDSLPRALSLGYAGTSHKNCKGVFKGVANRCLLAWRTRQERFCNYLMTGEDLANIGPVALLQDLAVCAALGLQGIERNGHHYFAGLSMFPLTVQQQMLATHGDLYHPGREGWPTLRIRDGMLRMLSVIEEPFGVGFALDVDDFPLV